MADTITLNAGSGGAVLGTDEVSIGAVTQHVQRVKLVDGADGGTALIGGDATNGLDVDVTRVSGNVTVVQSTASNLKVDASGAAVPVTDNGGALSVDDGAGSLTVDNAGTFAVQESGGALTALQIMDDWDNAASDGASVSGDVAHDAADAGEPVKIGGKALSADPTAVATGDRVNALFDLIGRLVVAPYAIPENLVDGVSASMTGTSDTQVIAAQGVGVRIYVTHIGISNTSATVGTEVIIKSGTTEKARYPAPAAISSSGANGAIITLPTPLRCGANEALNAACVTAGSAVRVTALGYKGA